MKKSRANTWNRVKKHAIIAVVCVALAAALIPATTSAWLSWDGESAVNPGGQTVGTPAQAHANPAPPGLNR